MMGKRGKVFLVGAGPGDPELITVKARRFLELADVVFHDALVHPDLLKHCRSDARLVYVGKRAGRVQQRQSEINQHLESAARDGQIVVALEHLDQGARLLEETGASTHAMAARRAAGQLRGALVQADEADAWFRERGVKRPAQFASAFFAAPLL
jgi:siroheme synthase